MEAVEKLTYRGPVRIGIGTPAQTAALRSAGAETVIAPSRLDEILADDQMRRITFRAGDTIVLAQGNLLHIAPMKLINAEGVAWEVIGNEAQTCEDEPSLRTLRQITAKGADVVKRERRGAPPIYKQPTPEQMQTIIGMWHTPTLKPAEIQRRVGELMGQDVSKSWVRDQVIKVVGHARRRP